jgi:hypothetical protein
VRVLFKLDYGGLGMAKVVLIMRSVLHTSYQQHSSSFKSNNHTWKWWYYDLVFPEINSLCSLEASIRFSRMTKRYPHNINETWLPFPTDYMT